MQIKKYLITYSARVRSYHSYSTDSSVLLPGSVQPPVVPVRCGFACLNAILQYTII